MEKTTCASFSAGENVCYGQNFNFAQFIIASYKNISYLIWLKQKNENKTRISC